MQDAGIFTFLRRAPVGIADAHGGIGPFDVMINEKDREEALKLITKSNILSEEQLDLEAQIDGAFMSKDLIKQI